MASKKSELDKYGKRELFMALHEAIKLQSHYATLLNMHDGGKRIAFRTVEQFVERLRETRK